MNIVIMSDRMRNTDEQDRPIVEALITRLLAQHEGRMVIFSAGCDRGVSRMVRENCYQRKLKFVEFRVSFIPIGEDFRRTTFTQVFAARNVALKELGDEFHLFLGAEGQRGLMISLAEAAVAKVGADRVFNYEG